MLRLGPPSTPSYTFKQVDTDKNAYWEVKSKPDDYHVERDADGRPRYVRNR